MFGGVDFSKKSKFLAGCLPTEDGSDRRETLGKRVSDDFAKIIFRGQKNFGGSIFREKKINWQAFYPPRMAPIRVKLSENAFQTILQK